MGNGKKKLLIVNNNLATGGVQRSLINLLHEIKDTYEVTIFVFSHSGEYKNRISPDATVIEASPLLRLLGMSQAQTKDMGYRYYYIRAVLALYAKIVSNHLAIRLLLLTQEKLTGFDIAISFLHNAGEKSLYGGCNEFVLRRVKAKEKMTFLHCDFSNYGGDTLKNRKTYRQFDKIATVSEGCQQSFCEAVPELAAKTQCVINCHDYGDYISQANDNPIEYPESRLNIVTIARLSPEKGILRAVDVINRLAKEGRLVRWHIVGDGVQRKEIENSIDQCKASEHIILYGNQENPYRYLKNADLLFLPSFHEAAPMVFDEAKCLGIPIMTTHTTSAKEMVAEGKEGFVSENSENGIYKTLKSILDNPRGLQVCREYLLQQQYSNEKALLQFHSLIDERN
ncbi:MAG: glycosyltransferase [Desulfosporosinus sp.]|nr:glycosyltransferase [Desulfosporosinus sp.]